MEVPSEHGGDGWKAASVPRTVTGLLGPPGQQGVQGSPGLCSLEGAGQGKRGLAGAVSKGIGSESPGETATEEHLTWAGVTVNAGRVVSVELEKQARQHWIE